MKRATRPSLLHPHELHVEVLLLYRLKIDSLGLVLLRIVRQRVCAAGVNRNAQLDENLQRRAIARGYGFNDVDRLGVEVDASILPQEFTDRLSKV